MPTSDLRPSLAAFLFSRVRRSLLRGNEIHTPLPTPQRLRGREKKQRLRRLQCASFTNPSRAQVRQFLRRVARSVTHTRLDSSIGQKIVLTRDRRCQRRAQTQVASKHLAYLSCVLSLMSFYIPIQKSICFGQFSASLVQAERNYGIVDNLIPKPFENGLLWLDFPL